MFSGALRVQREPLKHSSADLRRANETLARIHDIVVLLSSPFLVIIIIIIITIIILVIIIIEVARAIWYTRG